MAGQYHTPRTGSIIWYCGTAVKTYDRRARREIHTAKLNANHGISGTKCRETGFVLAAVPGQCPASWDPRAGICRAQPESKELNHLLGTLRTAHTAKSVHTAKSTRKHDLATGKKAAKKPPILRLV